MPEDMIGSNVVPLRQAGQVDSGWTIGRHALMNLHIHRQGERTIIEPHRWRIPYQWQPAHYQDCDDQPFLLLLNSAGGYVEGDVAELYAEVSAGARALITTSMASKFYKCPNGETSREQQMLTVGPGALLEYLPDEAIPFARSRVRRDTVVDIDPTSRLFATDMISAGRQHFGDGEVFAFDSLNSTFDIRLQGRSMVLDRTVAQDRTEVEALRGLWQGHYHLVTTVAYAQDWPETALDDTVAAVQSLGYGPAGATRIEDFIVMRGLAMEAWHAHRMVHAAWGAVRPILAGKSAMRIAKC